MQEKQNRRSGIKLWYGHRQEAKGGHRVKEKSQNVGRTPNWYGLPKTKEETFNGEVNRTY